MKPLSYSGQQRARNCILWPPDSSHVTRACVNGWMRTRSIGASIYQCFRTIVDTGTGVFQETSVVFPKLANKLNCDGQTEEQTDDRDVTVMCQPVYAGGHRKDDTVLIFAVQFVQLHAVSIKHYN